MVGLMEHDYVTVRNNLDPVKMAKLICRINDSDRYEVGELNFIYVKGTSVRVGYLGDETAELVGNNRPETRPLRNKLRRIFLSV